MNAIHRSFTAATVLIMLGAGLVSAQDWSQWRGNNRDAVAANFDTPEQWPKELVKQWTVEVGDGVSSPSILGDKVYVIALQGGSEIMRCLNAKTGEEIWKDEYKAQAASGPASGFAGTRSAPAIGEQSVVALGVDGTVSCWDAESGKLNWRNEDHRGQVPRFSTSSSPMIVDGRCIVQFGTDSKGGIAAYDLKTGQEKWTWTESGASYASPVLMTVGDAKIVLAPTASHLVAVSLENGKSVWSMEYVQGRYNAATPVVDGQTIYVAGPNRGITALELSGNGSEITSTEKWRNEDTETTVMYNSPVLFEGKLFGLSNSNLLFCVNTNDGTMAWNNAFTENASSEATPPQRPGQADRAGGGNRGGDRAGRGDQQEGQARPPRGAGGQRGQRGGGRRGGGGRGGYGSIVSVGSALVGLTPTSEMLVYQPSGDEFKEIARYKVSESPTYAYPILVGNRVYIKDKDSLTMWTLK